MPTEKNEHPLVKAIHDRIVFTRAHQPDATTAIVNIDFYESIAAELNRLHAIVTKQNAVIEDAKLAADILYDSPEINPSNYDHEQVCELNTKALEAWGILNRALAARTQEAHQ